MLTSKPRLRIVGHGKYLRVRQRGDWAADTPASLHESCRASTAIDKTLAEAIGRARAGGMSWAEVGRALGVAEQAETKEALIDALADSRRAVVRYLVADTA